ncbi:uncharacterized protein LOC144753169 isoform X2 [Lissotriton helveticus]
MDAGCMLAPLGMGAQETGERVKIRPQGCSGATGYTPQPSIRSQSPQAVEEARIRSNCTSKHISILRMLKWLLDNISREWQKNEDKKKNMLVLCIKCLQRATVAADRKYVSAWPCHNSWRFYR